MLGSLEVICGPMFSGKTLALIEHIKKWQSCGLKVQTFKHALDVRFAPQKLVAHNGESADAVAVSSSCDLLESIEQDAQVIAIDEIQFFDNTIFEICTALVRQGKQVVVAGLDLDFRGEIFGAMALFLASADIVCKLSGSCNVCGKKSRFSQRITNDQPACRYEPQVIVGAHDRYEARCWNCYEFSGEDCCQN
ncbi:MAG: Thymidine kinase [candidate division TM6 bacterium GW2011_GWE2_41_16]|nr:MAG: Thymidine kinase [candidate division TM6 bacterium GW2011_GWE2_41_16]